jgi:hypothetical protein
MFTPPKESELHKLFDEAAKDPNIVTKAVESASDLTGTIAVTMTANQITSKTLETEALAQIENEEIRAEFKKAYQDYLDLYARLNIVIPTLDEFIELGVDFAKLAKAHNQMKRDGLKPEFVISTPLPLAPDHTGASWREMFSDLTDDPIIYLRRLGDHEDDNQGEGPGLWVSEGISPISDQILAQEQSRIIERQTDDTRLIERPSNRLWTIVLIPGTAEPQHLNSTHSAHEGKHPSVSQLLALQAKLITKGELPIDCDATSTMVNETYNVTFKKGEPTLRSSLDISYNSYHRQIFVNYSGLSTPTGGVGARLIVWG